VPNEKMPILWAFADKIGIFSDILRLYFDKARQ